MTARALRVVASVLACVVAATLTAVPAQAWTPRPATYGISKQRDVSIPMSDGVVLHADVLRPATASGAPAPGRFPSKNQEVKEPRDVDTLIGACMMFRRELVRQIGPFDEGYFLFLEETDWCLRAWRGPPSRPRGEC